MTTVTVYVDEDEWWPWHHFVKRDQGRALNVDSETAKRWERGLAEAEALQNEIADALTAAYPRGRIQP